MAETPQGGRARHLEASHGRVGGVGSKAPAPGPFRRGAADGVWWTDIARDGGMTMASKDKGGGKGSKTAASKTLKEKRAAKKAKGSSGSSSNWSTGTK